MVNVGILISVIILLEIFFDQIEIYFYIVIGNPMLRNDYFHGFFLKTLVYISSSKTGFFSMRGN